MLRRNWQRQFGRPMRVRDFGAVGDGVADDTSAIRDCLAASGWPGKAACLEFEPLRYRLTGTVTLDAGSLASTPPLVIQGNGGSLVTTTQGLTMLEVTDAVVSETWLSVTGLAFRLNARNSRGVHLHNAEGSEFIGCLFSDAFGLGVELSGTSTSNTFLSCRFSNLGRGILISGGGHYTLIQSCSFVEQLLGDALNPALNWIEVAGQTDGIIVNGCLFYGVNATLPVVRLAGSRGGLVTGCVFRRSDQVAVQSGANGAGDPNNIMGCSFGSGARGGVHIAGGSRCVVSGNQFLGVSVAGPGLFDAVLIERKFGLAASGTGNVISGNSLSDVNARFMVNETGGATGNVVTGNAAPSTAGFNLSPGSVNIGNLSV